MLKFVRFLLCVLISISLLACFVSADEDFDGYIVRLNDKAINLMSGVSLFTGNCATIKDAASHVVSTIKNTAELYAPQGLLKVDDLDTIKYLESLGIVENYDKNVYCELYGYTPSLNAYYSQQWAFNAINAHYAWNSGFYGNDIRVAVIDSGVYPHDDLKHCLVEGYNFADNNTDTTDTYGHGTFVSGIIAAGCNNIGIVGLSHRATIVPFKITDGLSGIPIDVVISAIYAAVDSYDCDVINLSLGTQVPTDELYNAVNHAITNGVLVVAAAGNITANTPLGACYPAAYDEVISVANACKVETDGEVSYQISSTSQYQSLVDIAAPGSDLISLAPSSSNFASGSGTSFAAPYVSAVAAIAKCMHPGVDNATFSYALSKSANSSYKASSGQSDGHWGSGLLDVEAFVKYMYLRFPKTHYLSEIDVQPYGNNTSVYLHNPNAASKTYTLVLTGMDVTNNIKTFSSVKIIPITLGAYQTYEASFTNLGITGSVTAMIFDDLSTLVPIDSSRKP